MSRLAILTYHSIDNSGSVISTTPEMLARQVEVLAEEGYRALPLRAVLAERLALGRWPQRTVALTFDDGYRNVYTVALPTLARHGFAATVYVVSQHMGGMSSWDEASLGLETLPVLSWEQAAELLAAGWEVGSHTRTHRDLGNLSGATELRGELVGSRDEIQDRLGIEVDSFAYPYGRTPEPAVRIVASTYRAAVTTRFKRASDEPLHALPRLDMYYFQDPDRFRALLTSGLDTYVGIRRWGRRLRDTLRR